MFHSITRKMQVFFGCNEVGALCVRWCDEWWQWWKLGEGRGLNNNVLFQSTLVQNKGHGVHQNKLKQVNLNLSVGYLYNQTL